MILSTCLRPFLAFGEQGQESNSASAALRRRRCIFRLLHNKQGASLSAVGWVGTGARGFAVRGQRRGLGEAPGFAVRARRRPLPALAAAPGGGRSARRSRGSAGMLGMLSQGRAARPARLAAD